MFENKFNSKKVDPLVEAVMNAQKDGEIRRQAIAAVNEEFGVYNRNAVVREHLAAYDARIEEEYKCMKEGKPLDSVGKEDADVDNDGDSDKSDKYLLNRRKAIGKAMGKRMEEESDGLPPSAAAKQAAKQTSTPASTPAPTRTKDLSSTFSSARGATGMNEEEQIDEVSKRRAISAYRQKEGEERDTSKLHGLIKRKFGAETAKHAERAGAQDTVGLVRRGEDRGKEDSIARDQRLGSAARKTKGGKVHKQDTSTLKGNIKRRLGSHTKPKHLPEEAIEEAVYSAKAARAGEDIGKKGKEFENIAKSAAKRYGSKERGKKVAGAILKRIRAKHMEEAVVPASALKPGQTLGQYLNAQRGLTPVKGGKNDPSSTRFTGTKPSAPSQPGAPSAGDEAKTKSFLQSQGVGVKPPESRPAPTMSIADPKATRLTSPTPAASTSSASSASLPSMASGLPGSIGAKPAPTPTPAKPAGGFDAGAAENKKRATGALEESVQIGDNKYRIV